MKHKEKMKEDSADTPSPSPPAVSLPPTEKVLYDNRIKRKNVLALNEKVAAIREYEKMPVYKRIGRMFHCSPDQIKRIVHQKETILKAWEQRTRRCQDAKTLEMKVVRVSMLGKAVYDWIRRMMYYKDFMITDGLVQKMALQFKSAMGLQNFFPHQDWCDKFRQTYNIKENDSKLLKIGYTQGYSVQIKDVMKDVLSECTPDTMASEEHKQSTAGGGISDDDDDNDDHDYDDGDDDGDNDVKINLNGENDNDDNDDANNNGYNRDVNDNKTKSLHEHKQNNIRKLPTKLKLSNRKKKITSSVGTTLLSNPSTTAMPIVTTTAMPIVTTTAVTTINQRHQSLQSSQIRQLVALPIHPGIGRPSLGMTQKVLVATPITTMSPGAGQRTNISGGGVAPPMTMTIIPLATIAQAAPTISTLQDATTMCASADSKHSVPPPMVEIKKEIKDEPMEIMNIKQECISDDEDEQQEYQAEENNVVEPNVQNQLVLQPHASAAVPAPVAKPIAETIAQLKVTSKSVMTMDDENLSEEQTAAIIKREETDTMDSMDYDDLTLSSLRKIIQNQSTSTTTKVTTATLPTVTLQAAAAARPPPPSSSSALSIMPPLPPLMKAPNLSANTTISSSSVPINRAANKRKLPTTTSSGQPETVLPPIRSCLEARKYLKLLEDFALVRENFRLIGLLTRADEVLRELDGNDDVDVD